MRLVRIIILLLCRVGYGVSVCPQTRTHHHTVCQSLVIDTPEELNQLCECTIVEGNLHIMKFLDRPIPKDTTFPRLREITGHLLLFKIGSRPGLSVLFPNLTVIRGDEVLSHYAIVIDRVSGGADFRFRSLKVIGTGSAYVNMTHNSTSEDEAYWRNNFPDADILLSDIVDICSSDCRSNTSKLYNEVSDTSDCPTSCPRNCNKNGDCCSSQCLGGCDRGRDPASCVACRHFRQYGACERSCLPGKYKFRHRCVRRSFCEEKKLSLNTVTGECYKRSPSCPLNDSLSCMECVKDLCIKICTPRVITSIAEAMKLEGCQVINGSLHINISDYGVRGMDEVAKSLAELRKVRGYLRISNSVFEFLNFLNPFMTIGGNQLYKNNYSLVIERNPLLRAVSKDVSSNQFSLKISKGSALIEYNGALCRKEVEKLKAGIILVDKREVVMTQSNGLDNVLCAEKSLKIWTSRSFSPWKMHVYWESLDRGYPYILYYKHINTLTSTLTELFSDCNEHVAQKKYLSSELENNSVEVTGLKPHRVYAIALRRLPQGEKQHEYREAISNIAYGSTTPFNPSIPSNITVDSSESSSLRISYSAPHYPNGVVTHYNITIQLIEDSPILSCRNCPLEGELKSCICDSSSGDIREIPLSLPPTQLGDKPCLHRTPQLIEASSELDDGINSGNTWSDNLLLNVSAGNDRVATTRAETVNSIVDNYKGWHQSSSILTKSKSYTFPNLRTFGLYAVSVSACQCTPEGADGRVRCNLCSSNRLIAVRVRGNDHNDLVKGVISAEVDQPSGRIKLEWYPPPNPNAPIVVYTVEIREEDSSNNLFAICVGASNSSIETVFLKDFGSGNFKVRITSWNAASSGPSNHWIPIEIQTSPSRTVIIIIAVIIVIIECAFGIAIYMLWKKIHTCYMLPKYEDKVRNLEFIHFTSFKKEIREGYLIKKADLEINDVIYSGKIRSISLAKLQTEDRKIVALKRPMNDFSSRALELLLKEALILQNLDFAHVIKLLKIIVEPSDCMYVMEYMEQRDLHSYLQEKCAREDLSHLVMKKLAYDAAAGMTYLSSVGIIHRNLTSFNCLLDSQTCLKIAGFGKAIHVSNTRNVKSLVDDENAVKWLAPEILSNSSIHVNSDVWSYGVLIWEISTGGRTPYEGMSDKYVMDKVCKAGGFLEPPDFLPENFDILMAGCWQFSSLLRPSFAFILQKLSKFLPESALGEQGVREMLLKEGRSMAIPEEDEDLPSPEDTNSISNQESQASSANVFPVIYVPASSKTNITRESPITVKGKIFVKLCSCRSQMPKTCGESPFKRTYNKCAVELATLSESIKEKHDDEQIQCLLRDTSDSNIY